MTWERPPPGAGRSTSPQHHACVARPLLQSPFRGRRAGAGRGTAPQHHACVARPQRQWHGTGSTVSSSSGLGRTGGSRFVSSKAQLHTHTHTHVYAESTGETHTSNTHRHTVCCAVWVSCCTYMGRDQPGLFSERTLLQAVTLQRCISGRQINVEGDE